MDGGAKVSACKKCFPSLSNIPPLLFITVGVLVSACLGVLGIERRFLGLVVGVRSEGDKLVLFLSSFFCYTLYFCFFF